MTTIGHRTIRGGVAASIVVVLLGAGWAPSAPAQASEPAVTVTTTDGLASHATDCKGTTRTTIHAVITMTVARTGDTTDPLTVSLSIGGPLAAPSGLPTQVTIPAGASEVTLSAEEASNGSLWIDVIDTVDYGVAVPGSVQAQVLLSIADLGCNIGNPRSEQTIPVGTTPNAVDVERIAYGPPDSLERSIEGTPPTGTTFHLDGTWSGTATEVGTFFLREYFCSSDDWCPYRADIQVTVVPRDVPPDATPPARTAAPAAPVQAAPQLTG